MRVAQQNKKLTRKKSGMKYTQAIVLTNSLRDQLVKDSEQRTKEEEQYIGVSRIVCEILTAHYARRGSKK